MPSYRPRQKVGEAHAACQGVPGAGAGPHTPPSAPGRRVFQSQSGGPSNGAGSGSKGLGVPSHSQTPCISTDGTLGAGSSPGWPVRPHAHPRGSLRDGGTGPDQRRLGACACHRPPGPISAPGGAGRCRCHVFSPSGSAIVVPLRGCAGIGRPLRNRPPCGARGRCACLRFPHVCRPMPGGI